MSIQAAIRDAEWRLPGVAAAEGEEDPRWQAIIAVGDYVESDPEPVWTFADTWGRSDDPDLRSAIATCVLEHLLEHHFDLIFPRVERAVVNSREFADCFSQTWALGQTEIPKNRERFDALKAALSPPAS
jgi:hypothetical protein